ncbi:DotU family type IV/VI secretion system protein [Variovorax dokdonensis]|uniref:DotU family type IV/VI secretion system protein n=1 Tax=Variovorax dokdonensis TaxID=344883 RepID=A0ABT7NAR6_9BURK|nr:DotU family type IV/VI secretion system protein [Variovorax dokdonensis]MDM0044980.1 DotU family type IV/VI secretion system protein [Variovorax dokdonensis]
MTRLIDSFSLLIEHGLSLAAQQGRADAAMLPQHAERAFELLEQARAAARKAGYAPGAIESASFAMAAWIDEMLMRGAGLGPGTDAPIQQRLFNSNNARTEFFHHLSALQPEDDEVREVYWNALALGFTGQYYFEGDDEGELGKLKDLHGQQLATPPLQPLADGYVTPQPYSVAEPPRPRPALSRERNTLVGGSLLAVALPAAALAWLLLTGGPERPPTLAERVDARLQHFACADLSAEADDGALHVRGFVSRAEDVQAVRQEVLAVPGVGEPKFDLGLRIWPHCEVITVLKPYRARNRSKDLGLQLSAPSARDGWLREGDAVRLQLHQANFKGNVWVDYYTADGSVFHLLSDGSPQLLTPGQEIEMGRDIPASWLVSPPFGAVLVTALASPAPFAGTAERPPFELASDYLLRLREMLAANRGGDLLVADILELRTRERE